MHPRTIFFFCLVADPALCRQLLHSPPFQAAQNLFLCVQVYYGYWSSLHMGNVKWRVWLRYHYAEQRATDEIISPWVLEWRSEVWTMAAKGRALRAREDFCHPSGLIRSLSAGRQRWAEIIKNRSRSDIKEKREVSPSKGQSSGEQQWRRGLGLLCKTKECWRCEKSMMGNVWR